MQINESWFREIVDQNPYAIHLVNTEGFTLHVNQAFQRLLGRVPPPEYSIFKDPLLLTDNQREALLGMCRGEEREAPEFWVDTTSRFPETPARRLCIRLNAWPLRNDRGAMEAHVIMLEDITARKSAEDALRESEAKNRAFLQAIPDLFFLSTPDGVCLDYHSGTPGDLIAPPEAFLGRSVLDFLPPGSVEPCREAFRQAEATRRVQTLTYSVSLGERMVDFEARIVCCQPGQIMCIVRDVTERNQTWKALQESEQRFRGFFMNTSDGILWLSVLGEGRYQIEDLNPAAQAHLQCPVSTARGKGLGEVMDPEGAAHFTLSIAECLQSAMPRHFQVSLNLPSGRREFATLLVPVMCAEGQHEVVAIARDITQTIQHEQAMRQAQKLESLGVLAGGLAHDFNNLLTALLGNLNLAQLQLAHDSPALPFLDNVERATLRAAELTKQMLAYSGQGRFVVKPQDLGAVVQEMAHLLQVSIPKKVKLQIHSSPELPSIEADAAQLQQVVLNLVTNASDAIGNGEGSIHITTAVKLLDEEGMRVQLPGQSLPPGPYVMLEVSDTGCGMSQEVINRIFDPFYSTKASGRGLGLSALQGILRGHHAGFRIYSEIGQGTVFRLFFPAHETPIPQPEPPRIQVDPGMAGLILLVDDEDTIRETTATMLRAMGFEVVLAADGLAGVEAFERHAQRLRLVILDLTMPRMDGKEAYHVIRHMNPHIPIILSSGYTEQERSKDFQDTGTLGFLQKPYTFRELKAALQSSLS